MAQDDLWTTLQGVGYVFIILIPVIIILLLKYKYPEYFGEEQF